MLSEDKSQGNLTRRVRKAKRESPQKQCLPGKKKGDRENLSPVYGGGWFTTQELSISTQACQRVLGRECEVVINTQPRGRSYTEVARAIFDRFQQRRTLMLAELVDEGVRRGFFIPCHGLLVSEVILGAAMRIRRPTFLAQAALKLEEAFQEFYRMLLGGLLVEAASRGARTPHHKAVKHNQSA